MLNVIKTCFGGKFGIYLGRKYRFWNFYPFIFGDVMYKYGINF